MNRKLFVLPVMGAMLLISINLFANSVDYSTAQSASFIQMAARQAATDGADIVPTNPAGIALLAPGLYLSLNDQYYFMRYDESFEGAGLDEKYKDRRPITLFPNVYGVYNMGKVGDGNLAFALKAGVIGGGGYCDWNDGTTATGFLAATIAKMVSAGAPTTATSTDIKQKVSSVYYGFGGSAAYSFLDDKVSVSAGGQYIYAEKSAETTGTLYFNTPGFGGFGLANWSANIDSKFDCEANGYNMIFGLDVRPVEKLTVAFSYETQADLKFKFHEDRCNVTNTASALVPTLNAGVTSKLTKAGVKTNYDLPAIARMGAEYQFTPDFLMAAGGELFFVNNMDYSGVEKDMQKLGWEFNLGAKYTVIPSLLKIAGGITIADVGAKDSLFESEEVIDLMGTNDWSTHIFMTSCGFTYTIVKDLDLVVGWAHLITTDGDKKHTTESGYKVTYDRSIDNIAVAVNYKVF